MRIHDVVADSEVLAVGDLDLDVDAGLLFS